MYLAAEADSGYVRDPSVFSDDVAIENVMGVTARKAGSSLPWRKTRTSAEGTRSSIRGDRIGTPHGKAAFRRALRSRRGETVRRARRRRSGYAKRYFQCIRRHTHPSRRVLQPAHDLRHFVHVLGHVQILRTLLHADPAFGTCRWSMLFREC